MRNTKTAAGFTFVELLIVVVTMGLIAAVVSPSVARGYASAARRSSNREATATLFRARAIAIQRSAKARVVRTGNALQIWVDSSGTLLMVGGAQDVGQLYGATLTAPAGDTLQFDPRGFVVSGGQTPRIIITTGSGVDTVCVLGLGRIANRGC